MGLDWIAVVKRDFDDSDDDSDEDWLKTFMMILLDDDSDNSDDSDDSDDSDSDDSDEECPYNSVCMFRGKGVSWDPNINRVLSDNDDCYGEEGTLEDFDGPVMTDTQRTNVIEAIKEVLKKPKSQIELEDEDDTYEEWEEFMNEALCFLESFELIYCWF